MEDSKIFSHVDHTLLKATSSWAEIQVLCDEAIKYGTASVCVPPAYVKRINETYGEDIVICTVIGFPLGYNVTSAKMAEIDAAISEGAKEVDIVINLCDVKNGDFDKITAEIALAKKHAGNNILKVIIETCYLTQEEKIALCKCVTDGGADFIKTSTGFGTGGATLEDVVLMKNNIGPGVKIKAAGGIRTKDDMVAYIEAGCDRLGTSSAIKILTGGQAGSY